MEFIAFFLILASIIWLIKKTSPSSAAAPKPPRRSILANTELRLLAKDQSQTTSYNPDWVLRHLLKIHPQFFAPRDIKRVLADCIPHDEVCCKQGQVVSFNWYWIVELLENHLAENDNQFAYVLGWFDPRLWEPCTHLHAWFFSTPEEALDCATASLDVGKGKTKPDQKLFDYLKSQLDRGEKAKRKPENYWKSVSDPEPGD